MTQQDRDRLVVLRKAEKKLIGQGQAARELGITSRQVRRLLQRLKEDGDKAVIHKLRGRLSNRRTSVKTREKIVRILSEEAYRDFGPTLGSEYLASKHDIRIGREALRQIMIAADLWKAKGRKVEAVHQWRERRSCRGELIQWDTSTRDWLEFGHDHTNTTFQQPSSKPDISIWQRRGHFYLALTLNGMWCDLSWLRECGSACRHPDVKPN